MATPISSDVLDLLTGYLRDLTVARDGFAKALDAHKMDMDAKTFDVFEERLENIDGEISRIACSECWGADAKPYGLALHQIGPFTVVCDACYDKLNAKREPFDGDCARGF